MPLSACKTMTLGATLFAAAAFCGVAAAEPVSSGDFSAAIRALPGMQPKTNAAPVAPAPSIAPTATVAAAPSAMSSARLGQARIPTQAPLLDAPSTFALAAGTDRFGLASLSRRGSAGAAPLAFSASAEDTGLGFDVGFTPRIAIERDRTAVRRTTGAEVRLGENLDLRETDAPSWYIFAAADDQALTWDVAGEGMDLVDGVRLAERVTIGDLQAGVAFSRAGGQLAISYVRREFSYEEARSEENFAAISFTMRR